MRKVAYVSAFLVVCGILAGVLMTRPSGRDGQSLLINAAQAMEQIPTIHVRGRSNVWRHDSPPWGELDDGYYEAWYAEEGTRRDRYGADGNLESAFVANVATGKVWIYSAPSPPWFPSGVVTTYSVGTSGLATHVDRVREAYVDGQLMVKSGVEFGGGVTTGKGMRDRTEVTVVEAELGADKGTIEYYLDPATGRLLGLRQYGPESHGKPLTGEMDVVEYGGKIPKGTFDYKPPAGAAVVSDDFELQRSGGYCFQEPASFPGGWKLTPPGAAWYASASSAVGGTKPEFAIDGNPRTRWTGRGREHKQEPGMWFQLDFDRPILVSKMTAQHAERPDQSGDGWPRGIQISATSDGTTWHDVYTGQAGPHNRVYGHFNGAHRVRGIRLTLTKVSDEEPWSINEIELYGPPG